MAIALNNLYAKKEKNISCLCFKRSAYVWKHNSNRENQIIFLMISTEEKLEGKSEGRWLNLAV